MKTVPAVIVAASALAMLLLTPLQLAAHARGSRAFHFSGRLHAAQHHRAQGAWPFYGGFYGGGLAVVPSYAADAVVTYPPPAQVVYVPVPPLSLSCHRSQQTVTVPAEAGGTRQVTVTRC